MIIIGEDFHPEFQQIASVGTETGEVQEKRLAHREDAETFYRALAGQKVRVGMEASGHARWFERLVAELQFELWIGDAAEIRTKRVRRTALQEKIVAGGRTAATGIVPVGSVGGFSRPSNSSRSRRRRLAALKAR